MQWLGKAVLMGLMMISIGLLGSLSPLHAEGGHGHHGGGHHVRHHGHHGYHHVSHHRHHGRYYGSLRRSSLYFIIRGTRATRDQSKRRLTTDQKLSERDSNLQIPIADEKEHHDSF